MVVVFVTRNNKLNDCVFPDVVSRELFLEFLLGNECFHRYRHVGVVDGSGRAN